MLVMFKANTMSDPKCWLCLKPVHCLIPNVEYVKTSTLSDPKCWLGLKLENVCPKCWLCSS